MFGVGFAIAGIKALGATRFRRFLSPRSASATKLAERGARKVKVAEADDGFARRALSGTTRCGLRLTKP
ncbi:hypothetical protein THIOKS11770016 [Thiocapsa sp. KS1]|nr:hypothetical protein THIOKS11770016 [Thiocapsa sp. KS1]